MGPPTTVILDINGIVLAFLGTVTAIAAAYGAYQAAKGRTAAEESKVISMKTQDEVKEVAKHSNSMKDELVKEVRAASLAKGAQDQRELQGQQGPEVETTSQVPHVEKTIRRRPLGRKRK